MKNNEEYLLTYFFFEPNTGGGLIYKRISHIQIQLPNLLAYKVFFGVVSSVTAILFYIFY